MSVYEPDDSEPLDIALVFPPVEVDETSPPSKGRPDDYPGFECLAVLRTLGARDRAGKSYRPDPSGLHRAVKVDDYSLGAQFLCRLVYFESLEEVFELLKELSADPCKFVVRGVLSDNADDYRLLKVTNERGYLVRRRSVKHHGYNGHFRDVSRQLQMLDLDGVPLPDEMSVVADPEACIKWAVDNLFPSEFRETSFVYQLSSSAGLTKHDNELNVHLWFFTNWDYANEELRGWARWWNAKQQRKIIDPALFTSVQPHYTNEPELLDGLIDPLAGRRLGLIRRRRRTVKLYMPTAQEVAEDWVCVKNALPNNIAAHARQMPRKRRRTPNGRTTASWVHRQRPKSSRRVTLIRLWAVPILTPSKSVQAGEDI
jgi:hypothetical protein